MGEKIPSNTVKPIRLKKKEKVIWKYYTAQPYLFHLLYLFLRCSWQKFKFSASPDKFRPSEKNQRPKMISICMAEIWTSWKTRFGVTAAEDWAAWWAAAQTLAGSCIQNHCVMLGFGRNSAHSSSRLSLQHKMESFTTTGASRGIAAFFMPKVYTSTSQLLSCFLLRGIC